MTKIDSHEDRIHWERMTKIDLNRERIELFGREQGAPVPQGSGVSMTELRSAQGEITKR